jgi:hypothetical protein
MAADDAFEVVRLRAMLASLEWAGTACTNDGDEQESCPVCGATRELGHDEGGQRVRPGGRLYDSEPCWLAKEIAR